MSLEFGTDGIRGVANTELTAELSLALGRAAASVFGSDQPFLIGRDTRVSGPMIQAALSAGIASSGAAVIDLGVLPTPAVAFESARLALPAAVISASHNPFDDNGIKFFKPGGIKLDDATEEALELALRDCLGGVGSHPRLPDVGEMRIDASAAEFYVRHIVRSAPGADLAGLRVVIDCANGANSVVAPEALRLLGVDLVVLHAEPNGTNINANSGSTHPEALQKAVVDMSADIGLAFDGDADRVLAVDANGALVDGDQILALLAVDANSRGALVEDTIVVTVMSNLGLRIAMEQRGIRVHETKVGDRYVLEALGEHGWSLGGEQSGHIILPLHATTGDGLLAGVQLMRLVRESRAPLHELASASMTKLPQVLRNIRVKDRAGLQNSDVVWTAVEKMERRLGAEGRVLLRASGTEPLVRVMVEAPTQSYAEEVCAELCGVVERELG